MLLGWSGWPSHHHHLFGTHSVKETLRLSTLPPHVTTIQCFLMPTTEQIEFIAIA